MTAEAPILVIVSVDPQFSHRANEAVRIALGILAGENPVVVALTGRGAKILDADVEDYVDGEDLARHLATLRRLGLAFHVEREAVPDDPAWNPSGVPVIPIDLPELARRVAESRRTLAF